MAPDGDRKRYGHAGWSGPKDGHIVITADGCSTAIRLSEEGLPSRAHWEQRNSRYVGGRWLPPPMSEYEAKATGRLELALVSGFSSRSSSWADRKSWSLDEKLPEVLAELEIRAIEQHQREDEAKRRAAERQRQWEQAMEEAKTRYLENRRREVLLAQAQRWREAEAIRSYCDKAQALHGGDDGTREWIAWARRHADHLDPLQEPPRSPPPPDSIDPSELRPYLEGWSAYGPERQGW
jgi:hypothetical protein